MENALLTSDFSAFKVIDRRRFGISTVFSDHDNQLTRVVILGEINLFFTFSSRAHPSDNCIDFTRGQGRQEAVPFRFDNHQFFV